jgi:AhpD family alkylhydroperoxidase
MQLDERIIRLIAVGASVTANCQSCLDANARKAIEHGADQRQIAQAIAIGRMVRKGAASGMDRFISTLEGEPSPVGSLADESCECGS